MLKKSPSRSSRSKGIKVKHVLQIVLLVGVCFWLIYQVKRSHEKKKEFDQKDNDVTIKTQNGVDLVKLGRKDLHPHVEEEVHPGEKQEEDEEEETGGEVEDSKHEGEDGHEELKNEAGDEEDEGSKHEEETEDDGGRGGGDDDIDENDQDKADNESDREGENVDDEKLKEGSDEEAGGNEESDKEDQRENENSSDEQENDGGDGSTHEAREENYKGDDASSAVTHDEHSTSSETEEVNLENSNENLELNGKEQNSESIVTEELKEFHNSSRLTEEVDQMANNGTSTNENFSDVKLNENTSLPTDGSVQNSILGTQADDQPESSNNTSSVITETNTVENVESSQQNGTETGLNLAQNEVVDNLTAQNGTSVQSLILTNLNDTVLENRDSESQPNTTSKDENPNGVEGETMNITSKADLTILDDKPTEPEKDDKTTEPENVLPTIITQENSEATQNETADLTISDEKTTEPENVLPTMITQENSEVIQNEKSEGESKGESSDSTTHTEDLPVHDDPIDSNDSHVTERVDLDTLPDIRTGVDSSEETAAE